MTHKGMYTGSPVTHMELIPGLIGWKFDALLSGKMVVSDIAIATSEEDKWTSVEM